MAGVAVTAAEDFGSQVCGPESTAGLPRIPGGWRREAARGGRGRDDIMARTSGGGYVSHPVGEGFRPFRHGVHLGISGGGGRPFRVYVCGAQPVWPGPWYGMEGL